MKHLFATTLIVFTLAGCGAEHSGSNGVAIQASSAPTTAAQLQSFQTTVYSFGQTQGCVKCHGASVNPQWMNADLPTAYSFARPLLDINNPTTSLLATYAGNNHCNDPICADPANIANMQDMLLEWTAVELSQANNGPSADTGTTLANPPYVTLAMPIPSTLPLITASAPAVIRFDLSQLTPSVPSLTGVILELSIESYNSSGTTYKVFNPRIVGNASPVTVNGMHVYVRPASGTGLGTEDVNQGDIWSNLNVITSPVMLPATLPTGPLTVATPLVTTSLGIAQLSAADVITVGFVSIH